MCVLCVRVSKAVSSVHKAPRPHTPCSRLRQMPLGRSHRRMREVGPSSAEATKGLTELAASAHTRAACPCRVQGKDSGSCLMRLGFNTKRLWAFAAETELAELQLQYYCFSSFEAGRSFS